MAFHAAREALHAVHENTAHCALNTVLDQCECHGACYFILKVCSLLKCLPEKVTVGNKKDIFYFEEERDASYN